MEAEYIKKLLAQKHSEDIFVNECRIGGWPGMNTTSYMDGWAMVKSWATPNTIGYEVKVSRQDFIKDNKWHKYLDFCNQFYFVCPAKLIDISEVPQDVGMMWIQKEGSKIYTKKKAPRREVKQESMAQLYKGILMNRAKLTWASMYGIREPLTGDPKKRFFEEFINQKEEDRTYGRMLSGRIRKVYEEKIRDVDKENDRLKNENRSLNEVKKMLEEMGIRPTSWNVRKEVKDKLKGDDLSVFVSNLNRLKSAIANMEENNKELLDEWR